MAWSSNATFLVELRHGDSSMPAIYKALAVDEDRNALIFGDVLAALETGRHPVVLTERRDQIDATADAVAACRTTSCS